MPEECQSLGNAIRNRRIELGLTQEELAERIGDGFRQSDVSRLERDRIQLPRAPRFRAIARALQLEPGELLVRSGWHGAFSEHHLADETEPAHRPIPDARSYTPEAPASETAPASITPSLNSDDSLLERLHNAIASSQELRIRSAEVLQKSTRIAREWSGHRVDESMHVLPTTSNRSTEAL